MVAKTIEMLDSVKHSQLKINPKNYNCAQNHVNVASVMVNELSTVVHEYPIFITKNSMTGEFQLSGVLGFTQGENLYLKGDTWQANYLPLDILRRPFQLIKPEKGVNTEGHLAIDMSSPQLQDDSGEALFEKTANLLNIYNVFRKAFLNLLTVQSKQKTYLK